jgi:cytochrome c-type biogenesis protein CcmH/NrfF
LRKTLHLFCVALILLVAAASAGVVAAEESFDSEGYEEAISTILCDCGCHPQSVKACACGRAAEMRDDMKAMVVGGNGKPPMSGQAIIDWYVAQYGENIRISPTATGFNLVAWLGPLVGLLVAAALLAITLQRIASRRPEYVPALPTAPAAADDPYRDRLQKALDEFE